MKNLYLFPPVCMKKMLLVLILFFSHLVLSAQTPRDTTYATAQRTGTNGLCLGCQVSDSLNAVTNSNLNDYSTLSLGVSLLGASVSQTLIFPKIYPGFPRTEITIEIAHSDGLSVNLLGAVSVGTARGNTDNGDQHIIQSSALRQKPNSNRLTYTFRVLADFDRVTVRLHAGILALGAGLRIYSAYVAVIPPYVCAGLPAGAYAYYPFNGDFNDKGPRQLHGLGLFRYSTNAVCGLAASDSLSERGSPFNIAYPELSDTAITYAFWLRQLPWDAPSYADASFSWYTNQHSFSVFKDSIRFVFADSIYRILFMEPPTLSVKSYIGTESFTHVTVVCRSKGATLYISGANAGTINGELSVIGSPARALIGQIRNMNVDDLVIYNRSLTEEEVKQLYDAYFPKLPAFPTLSELAPAAEETPNREGTELIISPNPTHGTFRINKEIAVENSMAILTDMAGKEVFRTYLATHNVTLPAKVLPGVYLFRLRTKEGKLYNTKIIVGNGNAL